MTVHLRYRYCGQKRIGQRSVPRSYRSGYEFSRSAGEYINLFGRAKSGA